MNDDRTTIAMVLQPGQTPLDLTAPARAGRIARVETMLARQPATASSSQIRGYPTSTSIRRNMPSDHTA